MPADRREGGRREALAEHRGVLDDSARSAGSSASRREAMSAVSVSGTASGGQVADRPVRAVRDREPALGDEHPHRLDRVQRDAVGARDDGPDGRRRAGRARGPISSSRMAGSGERLEVQAR